ncbi:MAG: 5-(carboxyamino)imidazole ribonucleotide mutase [Candidatus Omnitrophica bacterium]|nr:5-(carboxyamino)imidazole ribonucleotide mutase [Candidatus Omnitrophota bacterium]
MKKVAVIVGSKSDKEQIEKGLHILDKFGVQYEFKVISAHRDPEGLHEFVSGLSPDTHAAVIAGAGMAAALPGVVASQTLLPVIGVPMKGGALNGVDALYSIVQMPKGVPVGCVAIGASGAVNAALLALRIMALTDEEVREKLWQYRQSLKEGK